MGNTVDIIRRPSAEQETCLQEEVERSVYYRNAVVHVAQMCCSHEKIDLGNCLPIFVLSHAKNYSTYEAASHISQLTNLPILNAEDLNEGDGRAIFGSYIHPEIDSSGSYTSNSLLDGKYMDGFILYNVQSLKCLHTIQQHISPTINCIRGICIGIDKDEAVEKVVVDDSILHMTHFITTDSNATEMDSAIRRTLQVIMTEELRKRFVSILKLRTIGRTSHVMPLSRGDNTRMYTSEENNVDL